VIGTPSVDDSSFVTDPKALEYLATFPKQHPKSLRKRYPGASKLATDLLKKLITFNPFFRPTVKECLEHSFFDQIRDARATEEPTCKDKAATLSNVHD